SYEAVAARHPQSFPTRRSSDLGDAGVAVATVDAHPRRMEGGDCRLATFTHLLEVLTHHGAEVAAPAVGGVGRHPRDALYRGGGRSEEHTSELQSRENLVCRLLL